MSSNEAFVTLATKDDYACGALVWAQSLRQVQTQKKLVVMISNSLSDHLKHLLREIFDQVVPVEELNTMDEENLRLLGRPELGITLTKINCWLLTEYSKCVFMDSDTIVLKNLDHLFEREEFSAAPDAGWPDCFNSGVFVYRPSKETFRKLMLFSSEHNASFDGGDQGLLNSFFSDWSQGDLSRHLPFTHNVTSNTFYSYLPAIQRFRNDIHVVHFAGSVKPWHLTYNPSNDQLYGYSNDQNSIQRDFLLTWWKIFSKNVLPKFALGNQGSETTSQSLFSSSQNISNGMISYSMIRNETNGRIPIGSAEHRRQWESGHADYQGKDSFDNISQHLNRRMSQVTSLPLPLPASSSSTIERDEPSNNSLSKTSETLPRKSSSSSSSQTEKIDVPPLQKKSTTNVTSSVVPSLPPATRRTEPSVEEKIPLSSALTVEKVKETSTNVKSSQWTVTSTILTAYTQGTGEQTGPTIIDKVVQQTTVTDQSKDLSTNSSGSIEKKIEKVTPSLLSLSWLFDQLSLLITYTISLCYIFIVLLFRKSSNDHSQLVQDKSVRSSPLTKSVVGQEKLSKSNVQ